MPSPICWSRTKPRRGAHFTAGARTPDAHSSAPSASLSSCHGRIRPGRIGCFGWARGIQESPPNPRYRPSAPAMPRMPSCARLPGRAANPPLYEVHLTKNPTVNGGGTHTLLFCTPVAPALRLDCVFPIDNRSCHLVWYDQRQRQGSQPKRGRLLTSLQSEILVRHKGEKLSPRNLFL
jgi:hypothetical protein